MKNIKLIILEAGKLLKDSCFSTREIETKSKFDLVTETDMEIELFLKERLAEIDSEIGFFGEELGQTDNNKIKRWIVDPIDGTAYFIFGIPYFSISVALEFENEIIEAHVYNPISEEYFFTSINEKSYLNDKEISVFSTNNFLMLL